MIGENIVLSRKYARNEFPHLGDIINPKKLSYKSKICKNKEKKK